MPTKSLPPPPLTFSLQHRLCQLLHVIEPWVDGLVGLLEHLDKLPGLLGIGRGEEGVRRTSVLSSSCAANTMNVVFRVGRKVKIDDILNVSHIFGFFQQSVRRWTLCGKVQGGNEEDREIVQSG